MNNQIFFHDDDDDDVEDDEYLENREFEDLAFLQLVTQTSTNFIENRRVIDLVNDDDNDIELNSTRYASLLLCHLSTCSYYFPIQMNGIVLLQW